MKKLPALIAIAALAVTGCAGVGSAASRSVPLSLQSLASTVDPCAASAADYNGVVAGSFVTTVGAIRALEAAAIEPQWWPGLPDSHPAVLCYIDGQIPKGPPPPMSGTVPPSFDRAVIAVIDGQSDLIMAGHRDSLPVVAPAAAGDSSGSALPSGGISEARAVQLAQEHVPNPVFLSAAAGPFAEVNAILNLGPGVVAPQRLVWALRFQARGGAICPPPLPGGSRQGCWVAGPTAVMVILDYYTGDFVIAGGPIESQSTLPSGGMARGDAGDPAL